MLLLQLDRRLATVIRLLGGALITWTVVVARYGPGAGGRGLVVSICLGVAVVSWAYWTVRAARNREPGSVTPDLYLLAAAGGWLTGASPSSAASAFAFVAVVAAAVRVDLERSAPVAMVATLALAVSVLVYDGHALGLLAYALGFAGALMAASNARQSRLRAEQAELLLAQTQRTHEEQLRTARLQESTRLARDIHDVLAHALAGLTIQLEATAALLEAGADREAVLARVRRAHELAREGLQETRRAVGALRGETSGVPEAIESLAAGYRSAAEHPARLRVEGDPARLTGAPGEAVLRVVQEALTNVTKHAPGAEVTIAIEAGEAIAVVVENAAAAVAVGAGSLASSGGGYGLRGMRERARSLGGTLEAGPAGDGWRVQMRLPSTTETAA